MHSLYAKITFVNDPLFPDVYFVFFNTGNCVFLLYLGLAIVLGHNISVCHLLFNKEIPSSRVEARIYCLEGYSRESWRARQSETIVGSLGVCPSAVQGQSPSTGVRGIAPEAERNFKSK